MSKQRLYLFVGYPGAGKTTVAKLIAKATGAVHLWADQERHKMFTHPTHSVQESTELYEHLNIETDRLLKEGKSVIFDTNFNFYKDRKYLRAIADKYGADTVLIWVKTPAELAKERAVYDSNLRNGYLVAMSDEQFNDIAVKLEQPAPEEEAIVFDGSGINAAVVKERLGL